MAGLQHHAFWILRQQINAWHPPVILVHRFVQEQDHAERGLVVLVRILHGAMPVAEGTDVAERKCIRPVLLPVEPGVQNHWVSAYLTRRVRLFQIVIRM